MAFDAFVMDLNIELVFSPRYYALSSTWLLIII